MSDKDWLDDIFDKSDSELSDELRARKHALRQVMTTREEQSLPWDKQRLIDEKDALFAKIGANENKQTLDQPSSMEELPTIRNSHSTITRVTRYFVPAAMAASVAMVALTLMPLTSPPTFDDATLHSLIENAGLPSEYQVISLKGGNRGISTDNEDWNFVVVEAPNRTTYSLIDYLHSTQIPYQLIDGQDEHLVEINVLKRLVQDLNKKLADLGIDPIQSGSNTFLIKGIEKNQISD